MPYVTKHDGKEEREGDDGEHCRVGFPVSSHTIGVDDVLEGCCYFGGMEMGGWGFICEDGLEDSAGGGGSSGGGCSQGFLYTGFARHGDPGFCD